MTSVLEVRLLNHQVDLQEEAELYRTLPNSGELATAAQSALAATSLTGAIGGAGGLDPTGLAAPPGSAPVAGPSSTKRKKMSKSAAAAAAAAAAAMNPGKILNFPLQFDLFPKLNLSAIFVTCSFNLVVLVLDVGGSFDEVMGEPGSTTDDLLRTGEPGAGADQDWYADPSEPRYCICNQVSYGDMVACDNEDVSIVIFETLPTFFCSHET